MAGAQCESQGRRARLGRREAALGSQRAGPGVDSRRAQTPEREHRVDHGSRRRVPRPGERRDGRRSAPPCEGQGRRKARDDRAAESRNEGRRVEDRHRDPAREHGSRLRPDLQPDGDLGAAVLPLSADLLPALLRRRLDGVGPRCRDRDRDLGRLGLGLRLGREQQHHHQQQQQLREPPQPRERKEPHGQQQLAARREATRRRPVQGSGHGRKVRRRNARRLGPVAPVAGPDPPVRPCPLRGLRPQPVERAQPRERRRPRGHRQPRRRRRFRSRKRRSFQPGRKPRHLYRIPRSSRSSSAFGRLPERERGAFLERPRLLEHGRHARAAAAAGGGGGRR